MKLFIPLGLSTLSKSFVLLAYFVLLRSSIRLANLKNPIYAFSIPKYTKNNLQQILKLVLKSRLFTALIGFFNGLDERFLKTRVLNVY